MEDAFPLREAPPVQEEAHVQQEDPPGTSEAASAEASGAYSSEAYMGPDLFKITRPFVRRRALWVALAALASSIVLLLIIETQLHLVEKAPPIKPQELPEGEPKGPTEELLPPKLQRMVDKLAGWTKYLVNPPEDKPLDEEILKGLIWEEHEYEENRVKYTLAASFTRLTPKYDPKKMTATVLKEVPKFFAEVKEEADYELGLSRRPYVRSVLLGDEGGDQLRVTITVPIAALLSALGLNLRFTVQAWRPARAKLDGSSWCLHGKQERPGAAECKEQVDDD
ncbi:hypothetical protein Emed_007506 [Eimeria media]